MLERLVLPDKMEASILATTVSIEPDVEDLATAGMYYEAAQSACPSVAVRLDGEEVSYTSEDSISVMLSSIQVDRTEQRMERWSVDLPLFRSTIKSQKPDNSELHVVTSWNRRDAQITWVERTGEEPRYHVGRPQTEGRRFGGTPGVVQRIVAHLETVISLSVAQGGVRDDGERVEFYAQLNEPRALGRFSDQLVPNGFMVTPGYCEVQYDRVAESASLRATFYDCQGSPVIQYRMRWPGSGSLVSEVCLDQYLVGTLVVYQSFRAEISPALSGAVRACRATQLPATGWADDFRINSLGTGYRIGPDLDVGDIADLALQALNEPDTVACYGVPATRFECYRGGVGVGLAGGGLEPELVYLEGVGGPDHGHPSSPPCSAPAGRYCKLQMRVHNGSAAPLFLGTPRVCCEIREVRYPGDSISIDSVLEAELEVDVVHVGENRYWIEIPIMDLASGVESDTLRIEFSLNGTVELTLSPALQLVELGDDSGDEARGWVDLVGGAELGGVPRVVADAPGVSFGTPEATSPDHLRIPYSLDGSVGLGGGVQPLSLGVELDGEGLIAGAGGLLLLDGSSQVRLPDGAEFDGLLVLVGGMIDRAETALPTGTSLIAAPRRSWPLSPSGRDARLRAVVESRGDDGDWLAVELVDRESREAPGEIWFLNLAGADGRQIGVVVLVV